MKVIIFVFLPLQLHKFIKSVISGNTIVFIANFFNDVILLFGGVVYYRITDIFGRREVKRVVFGPGIGISPPFMYGIMQRVGSGDGISFILRSPVISSQFPTSSSFVRHRKCSKPTQKQTCCNYHHGYATDQKFLNWLSRSSPL